MSLLDGLLLAIPPLLGITIWFITDDDPSARRRLLIAWVIMGLAAVGVMLLRTYVIVPNID